MIERISTSTVVRLSTKKDGWPLESGGSLEELDIAYETYGTLNESKDNAILILHAFSGNAHAAGPAAADTKPGWWDSMIGPGRAFDTNTYFMICSNVPGGCAGSTGPSSVRPSTGRPYGASFPQVTVGDMVRAQKALVDHLGIRRLLAVAGGSMGGMQVLEWVGAYPDMLLGAIPIATTLRHSPQQIAFNEVGRQAIMADPNWKKGDYYPGSGPINGLAVARMVGHITYMSHQSMEKKFSRRVKPADGADPAESPFEVEGYLRYRGDEFVKRFDANSYLAITRSMDLFDRSGKRLIAAPGHLDTRFLVISFASDWLYPSWQSKDIVRLLKTRHLEATYYEIKSTYGHDAFLLETEEQTHVIRHFLKRLAREGAGRR